MINEKIDILNEFCERWDFINTDKEKFELLKKKINNLLNTIFTNKLISDDIINELKSHMGDSTYPINKSSIQLALGSLNEPKHSNDYNIHYLIINVSDTKKLMYYLQLLFLLDQITSEQKEKLYIGLQDIIFTSNFTNIVYLEKREKHIIILPTGEPTLDKVLITQTIPILQEYEIAYKSYMSAMKDFMNADSNDLVAKRDAGDKLRVSFETFLKSRFGSSKNSTKDLINQVVSPFLKGKNVHVDIVSTYSSIANKFFSHANDTTKHNFKDISIEELEYLVYLMGSMIRLIHQLDQRIELN